MSRVPPPPEYLIIIDDLSHELKSEGIDTLLKQFRHFKCKVIISTQDLLDLPPSGRKQLDYVALFPLISRDRLKTVHKDLGLIQEFEPMERVYKAITATPYNFMLIDRPNKTLRNKLYPTEYNAKEEEENTV